MKSNVKEAMQAFKKARELAAQTPSPFKGMTMQHAIQKMRKIRQELWEEKFAFGTRHK